MTDLTFVELFAGVGGMSRGLEIAGWRCVGHAEWDDHARAVLRRQWPDVPLWGDVSQLNGHDLVQEVGPFTMLTFGAPCQDFSIAGKRSGMDGERSVLVLDALRIWEESQAPFALYENVVGMLSSNKGEDFAGILSVFVGDAVAVPPKGWRGGGGVVCGRAGIAAWRVLDAQYFGVPQRRRRVFVLGTRTRGVDPSQVLSLLDSLSGHPPTRRAPRQGAPADAGTGATGESKSNCLTPWDAQAKRVYSTDGLMGTLPAAENSGQQQMSVFAVDMYNQSVNTDGIAHSVRVQGVATDAGQGAPSEGLPTGFSTTGSVGYVHDVMPSLPHLTGLNCPGAQMMGVLDVKAVNISNGVASLDSVMGTLDADGASTTAIGAQTRGVVLSFQPGNIVRGEGPRPSALTGDHQNRVTDYTAIVLRNREGKPGGGKGPLLSPERERTLGTANDQVVFMVDKQTGLPTEGIAPTLKTDLSHQMGPVLAMASGQANAEITENIAPSLTLLHEAPIAFTPGVPRRLTPVECERLMGWPDGWTAQGLDAQGRPYALSDTARYKACGNGVASPVAAWIGFRLREALTDSSWEVTDA